MSQPLEQMVDIYPPTTTVGGSSLVSRLTVSTSSAAFEIPTAWRGRYVTFQAKGADIYLVFGTSVSVSADTTASSVASNVISNGAGVSYRIPQDQERSYRLAIPATITHFAARGTAAGELECFASTGTGLANVT